MGGPGLSTATYESDGLDTKRLISHVDFSQTSDWNAANVMKEFAQDMKIRKQWWINLLLGNYKVLKKKIIWNTHNETMSQSDMILNNCAVMTSGWEQYI